MRIVPLLLEIPARPALPRKSVRSGRSRPSLIAGITSVPPARTVIPDPSPNADTASSADVGTRTLLKSVILPPADPSGSAALELRRPFLAERLDTLPEIV